MYLSYKSKFTGRKLWTELNKTRESCNEDALPYITLHYYKINEIAQQTLPLGLDYENAI